MAKTAPTDPHPGESVSERDLLAACRAGDRDAAEVIAERTYRAVYAALFRMTGGDRELASDLTQETYRRAWQALPRFEGRSRLATWLYRIAYTTFLNHLRRPHPVAATADPAELDPVEPGPDPEDRAHASALDLRLRREVLRLPDALRFTITARFWGDRPVREIAREEGVSTVAIRKRLKKAMGLLALALGEDRS